MGVYSNKQIREAIEDGHIVCTPFNPKHVNLSSLDVTLGYHYFRIERMHERTIYNPFDKEDVERYFDGPYKAMPLGEWSALNGFRPAVNIPLEHPVISLKPGERILVHTHEFFGIKPPGACELRCRSSWARNGIAIGFDAGWIDPGYTNRLTMKVYNLNDRETVLLPVGERLAQIIFHETGEVDGNYGLGRDDNFSGKYQRGTDLETIIRTWSPDMMLPQSYRDARELPPTIDGATYD